METETILPWAHKFPFPQRKMSDPKEQFYRQFQSRATSIGEQIDLLPSLSTAGGERQDATEHVLSLISRLTDDVADASDFVPAYDQRTYSEAVKALSDKLNEQTSLLAPKSRFQFKPRTATTGRAPGKDARHLTGVPLSGEPDPVGGAAAQEQQDSVGALPSFPSKDYNAEIGRPGNPGIRKPSFSVAKEIAIYGQSGLHIMLPSTASRATSSGSLKDLTGCIVDMSLPTAGSAAFAGLAIKDIKRSLIVAGRVSGSAHITGVQDSVVVVAARQVRIHECRNVDFYLHVGSHPIIEDCTGVRFAPLPEAYITDAEDPEQNQWDQVDDFKWLKTEPSPNWTTIPEAERISEEVWKDVVPGGPKFSTSEILSQVGVPLK